MKVKVRKAKKQASKVEWMSSHLTLKSSNRSWSRGLRVSASHSSLSSETKQSKLLGSSQLLISSFSDQHMEGILGLSIPISIQKSTAHSRYDIHIFLEAAVFLRALSAAGGWESPETSSNNTWRREVTDHMPVWLMWEFYDRCCRVENFSTL